MAAKLRTAGMLQIVGGLVLLIPLSQFASPLPSYPDYYTDAIFYRLLIYFHDGVWIIATAVVAVIVFGLWARFTLRNMKHAVLVTTLLGVFFCLFACYFCVQAVFPSLEHRQTLRIDSRELTFAEESDF